MRKDLIEAYEGYYEEEIERSLTKRSIWVEERIKADSPKERLDVYLTWNGIIGYTESIYAIATGEI